MIGQFSCFEFGGDSYLDLIGGGNCQGHSRLLSEIILECSEYKSSIGGSGIGDDDSSGDSGVSSNPILCDRSFGFQLFRDTETCPESVEGINTFIREQSHETNSGDVACTLGGFIIDNTNCTSTAELLNRALDEFQAGAVVGCQITTTTATSTPSTTPTSTTATSTLTTTATTSASTSVTTTDFSPHLACVSYFSNTYIRVSDTQNCTQQAHVLSRMVQDCDDTVDANVISCSSIGSFEALRSDDCSVAASVLNAAISEYEFLPSVDTVQCTLGGLLKVSGGDCQSIVSSLNRMMDDYAAKAFVGCVRTSPTTTATSTVTTSMTTSASTTPTTSGTTSVTTTQTTSQTSTPTTTVAPVPVDIVPTLYSGEFKLTAAAILSGGFAGVSGRASLNVFVAGATRRRAVDDTNATRVSVTLDGVSNNVTKLHGYLFVSSCATNDSDVVLYKKSGARPVFIEVICIRGDTSSSCSGETVVAWAIEDAVLSGPFSLRLYDTNNTNAVTVLSKSALLCADIDAAGSVNPNLAEDNKGSNAETIGILFGVIFGILLLVCCLVLCCNKYYSKREVTTERRPRPSLEDSKADIEWLDQSVVGLQAFDDAPRTVRRSRIFSRGVITPMSAIAAGDASDDEEAGPPMNRHAMLARPRMTDPFSPEGNGPLNSPPHRSPESDLDRLGSSWPRQGAELPSVWPGARRHPDVTGPAADMGSPAPLPPIQLPVFVSTQKRYSRTNATMVDGTSDDDSDPGAPRHAESGSPAAHLATDGPQRASSPVALGATRNDYLGSRLGSLAEVPLDESGNAGLTSWGSADWKQHRRSASALLQDSATASSGVATASMEHAQNVSSNERALPVAVASAPARGLAGAATIVGGTSGTGVIPVVLPPSSIATPLRLPGGKRKNRVHNRMQAARRQMELNAPVMGGPPPTGPHGPPGPPRIAFASPMRMPPRASLPTLPAAPPSPSGSRGSSGTSSGPDEAPSADAEQLLEARIRQQIVQRARASMRAKVAATSTSPPPSEAAGGDGGLLARAPPSVVDALKVVSLQLAETMRTQNIKLSNVFTRMRDASDTGKVTQSAFKAGASSYGLDFPDATLTILFDFFDTGNKGHLSVKEFQLLCRPNSNRARRSSQSSIDVFARRRPLEHEEGSASP